MREVESACWIGRYGACSTYDRPLGIGVYAVTIDRAVRTAKGTEIYHFIVRVVGFVFLRRCLFLGKITQQGSSPQQVLQRLPCSSVSWLS